MKSLGAKVKEWINDQVRKWKQQAEFNRETRAMAKEVAQDAGREEEIKQIAIAARDKVKQKYKAKKEGSSLFSNNPNNILSALTSSDNTKTTKNINVNTLGENKPTQKPKEASVFDIKI